jgi:RimJ/RimL family protein N-acetyltransferase
MVRTRRTFAMNDFTSSARPRNTGTKPTPTVSRDRGVRRPDRALNRKLVPRFCAGLAPMVDDAEHLPELIDLGSIVLRRHTVEDADAIAEAIAESLEDLRPWMPWASDDEATQPEFQGKRLEEVVPTWGRPGHEATYVIQEPEGTAVLGVCSIQHRGDDQSRELGYWVRSAYQRKGMASRAADALTEAALALPGVTRVEIQCDVANERSAAVARRCGYRLDRTKAHEPQAPGHTGRFMVWIYPPDE